MLLTACPSEPQERVGTPANCLGRWRDLKKFLGGAITFLRQAVGQKCSNARDERDLGGCEAINPVTLEWHALRSKSFRLCC